LSDIQNILIDMQADNLLKGSLLLSRMAEFPPTLLAVTNTTTKSFDDYYVDLQDRVASIPRLVLQTHIGNQQAQNYEIELINQVSELQDQIQPIERDVINFIARIKDATSDVEDLSAEFEGWYILAATDYLKSAGIKLPSTNIKSIARAEFNRLTSRASIGLSALYEASKIMQEHIKNKHKMIQKKFEIGQQQVQAEWIKNLPGGTGGYTSDREDTVTFEAEEDLDGIPAYVSKAKVQADDEGDEDTTDTPTPGMYKTGDPQPVRIVSAEEALTLLTSGDEEDNGADELNVAQGYMDPIDIEEAGSEEPESTPEELHEEFHEEVTEENSKNHPVDFEDELDLIVTSTTVSGLDTVITAKKTFEYPDEDE
jgi:hypothetical protein